MTQEPKLDCPDCGVEMNHQAMTLDYGIDDPEIVESIFGGVLKEA